MITCACGEHLGKGHRCFGCVAGLDLVEAAECIVETFVPTR